MLHAAAVPALCVLCVDREAGQHRLHAAHNEPSPMTLSIACSAGSLSLWPRRRGEVSSLVVWKSGWRARALEIVVRSGATQLLHS